MPEGVRYHPGHAWVAAERPHLATGGMDEFAAALAGKVDRIELPKPGTWIRQGQKAWKLFRNGQAVEMVSPMEGEVVEVNAERHRRSGAGPPRPLRQRLADAHSRAR